jgi:hypothetical protein
MILSLLPLFLTLMAEPQLSPGDPLPTLKGEFLSGRVAILPEASTGKAALLLFGFTYDSRFSVEAWAAKFRHDYGSDPRLTFFEVPMIGGLGMLGKPFIDGGMRRGTPKSDHEHVITVYGGVEPWKHRVGYRDPKAAYLILIDAAGRVLWRESGAADSPTYEHLAAEIAKLPVTVR